LRSFLSQRHNFHRHLENVSSEGSTVHENIRPTFIDPPSANLAHDLWTAVVRHKNKAIVFFLVVTVLTAVATLLTPKTYHSEAKLLVRLGRENSTLDPTVMSSTDAVLTIPQPRENEINSVAEILHSRSVAERVVDQLTAEAILGRSPRADGVTVSPMVRELAVQTVVKNLVVNPVRRTNVISLGYDAKSPEIARKVIASVIDSYLAEHLRLNRPAGAQEFLAEETARVRAQLTAAEEKLRDVKNETGLASPDSQREVVVAQKGRLEDDLRQIRAQLAASRAKVQSLEASMATMPETEVVSQTTGHPNEGTDNMRGQFYSLQLREQSLAAKLTDDHPLLQEARRQVEEARAVVERQEASRTQVTTVPNRVRQGLKKTLSTERPLMASLEARQAEIQTQLADASRRLETITANSVRIAALVRDVQLLEANYRRFAGNLDQAHIDEALETQRISNISIAQAPSFEPRHIRPRKLWNLLLGMAVGAFGGLGLAIGVDYVERSHKRPAKIESRGATMIPPPVTVWRRKPAAQGLR
jgi:uncharacterized protein involved in exopolysaccharide biosynthesis